MIYQDFGKYKFDFLSEIKNPPIKLLTTGKEIISDSSYHLDNRHREECYLFQYTLSGSGTLLLRGEKNIIGKGSGFLISIPDSDEYFFDENENKEPWQFIYVKFKGDGCKSYYNLIKEKVGNILHLEENSKSLLSLFEIYRRAKLDLITDSFTSERLAFDFLCKLCSDCLGNPSEFSDIVIRAKAIIDSEFSSLDGVFDVAQRLCISQSHLSRVFSEETKMSPVEYLTKVRLRESLHLLLESDASVEKTAKKCGFSNGNYFCKVFRKYMGMSPLEYRKNAEFDAYDRITI